MPPDSLPAADAGGTALQIDYVPGIDAGELLGDAQVLAVFGFGDEAPRLADPRYLRVPLQPYGDAPLEAWRCRGPVRHGREGAIAWAGDGELQFGAIEIDENGLGPEEAARQAYAQLSAFVSASATPHLLRIWNYLDAITEGDGDAERYRQFCLGRARGWQGFDLDQLPAATGIGRRDGQRVIQVYWLAAARPGHALENPRQVSAWRYPRQYGPQPPTFARAMLPPPGAQVPLLLSGTASVVGHETRHAGDVLAQLRETFVNFDALLGAAHAQRPSLPDRFGAASRLKVYVREAADLPRVAAALDHRFGRSLPRLLLHADVCRRDLLVEIDGSHD
ncbi:pteridine-dependent deoxygenase [Stenotrophomonas sp. MMGLT7]|uniref:chorismate transformation enzyme, FkbO/Hyg5 family n=1 Tax=Stenotrophomonas sp. MMGLT7 TaxID=2901227 RepID=UPI001E5DC4EC|nr:pteridine-dependent deoxygenase [Stenotrophomonas sp. MMGLT7]MCD7099868.1 pteridine-dependent deoxygenase [Stenotrophomonas sp. MMGLT7]